MSSREFPNTDRYVQLRCLGEGTMGVVFGAFDRRRRIEVALKVLQRVDSEGILALKREFRSLAEVSHPNLVSLYELLSERESWFFTMELVDGVDFRSWAWRSASDGNGVGLARVRDAMRQLAEGISCVHRAGKLHRDVKPKNVLVTPAGRVVLLDFGLVKPELAPAEDGRETSMSGTPEYMAPEVALGSATPASDWYAAGAMLYEVLVGRLPFDGDTRTVVHHKLTRAPPDARALVPEAGRDLADLAMRLLSREPERRPTAAEILGALGAIARPVLISSSAVADQARPFVGRRAQLAALEEAFGALARGRSVVALVSGPSGVGKSTLCRRFLEELERGAAPPLVLQSRCYERESVPFKAIDGLVDALAAELTRRPHEDGELVSPSDREVLAHMFPALRRFWPGDPGTAAAIGGAAEARTLRRRAGFALRQLVKGVAGGRRVVVHVDDVQWGDADSFEVLGGAIAGWDPPALWVLSHRGEDDAPPVQAMLAESGADVRRVPLGPLPSDECVALALQLLGDHDAQARHRAERLADEAAGSPLFLSELVSFERDRLAAGPHAGQLTTLEELLRARVSLLSERARRLLELLAVAGRPLPQRLLGEAGGDLGAMLSLRNANLVRTSGVRDEDTAETYHDRVRELVAAMLSPARKRSTHGLLVTALEQAGDRSPADLEAIAYHALEAGETATALRYSLVAARRAQSVYATRDAVRHFEAALRLLGDDDRRARSDVEAEAAEACRQAGLHDRAVALLTHALEAPRDDSERSALHVSRGRVFSDKGDTEAAISDLETAFRLLGKSAPSSGPALVASTAAELGRHLAGPLLRALAPRRPDAALVERQAKLLLGLARIYYFADQRKVLWAGLAFMNLARASDRDDTRALVAGDFAALLLGMGLRKRAIRHCERAMALARRSGSRVAEGIALSRAGTLEVFENDLEKAIHTLRRSVALLKDATEPWELLTSLMLEAVAHFMAGRLLPAEDVWKGMATVAGDVGGAMHRAWAMSWRSYLAYLRGDASAEAARAELRSAVALSRKVGDVANQVAAESHLAVIAVVERDGDGAARAALALSRSLERYRVLVPFLQAGLFDAAEAALLGLSAAPEGRRAGALRKVVRRSLARAERIARSYPYLKGPLLRVRALEAAHAGRADAARAAILEAVRVLERSPNRLWLASAYAAAAQLVPEDRLRFLGLAGALREELKVASELIPGIEVGESRSRRLARK